MKLKDSNTKQEVTRKVKNPVEFLTSQIKLNLDAIKLVKEDREDF